MSRRTIRTARRRTRFLEVLESTGHVLRSAEMAGASVRAFYTWREDDPDFAAAWETALERAVDRLEDEAFRRALEGVEVPVYYQGKPVGAVCKYSDRLLMFLLTRLRARKYGEGAEGPREQTALENMTDDEIDDEIRQLAAEEAAAGAAARAGAAAEDAED